MNKCPNCNANIVSDKGIGGKYLVVLEQPTEEELRLGSIFSGKIGELLKEEMLHAKISYISCHYTTLWQHKPIEEKGGKVQKIPIKEMNEGCLTNFIAELSKKMEGKEAVLLIGTGCVTSLISGEIPHHSLVGLDVRDKLIIKPNCGPVIVMPNPVMALHSSIGEIRLALSKFERSINGR